MTLGFILFRKKELLLQSTGCGTLKSAIGKKPTDGGSGDGADWMGAVQAMDERWNQWRQRDARKRAENLLV